MNIFCTLFDSKYLDKGLALYYSMEKVMREFTLYIFAFDKKCEDTLNALNLNHAIVIGLQEFETDQMLKLKTERSKAEYCWTCTPISIEYVFDKYKASICTYLDADLYFFSNPSVLLDEIKSDEYSVMITEHRFQDNKKGRRLKDKNGKYCVQFNTFKNNEQGRRVLSWWREKCIEWCYFRHEDNRMGDQKYLDNWTKDFKGVHELKNLGGGLAYWNLMKYDFSRIEKGEMFLRTRKNNEEFKVVFVHFQNLRYLPFNKINLKAGSFSKEIKYPLYFTYLSHIEKIRAMIYKEYRVSFEATKSCSTNKLVAFIQTNMMQFKVRNISDIVDLKSIHESKYLIDIKGFENENIV